MLESSIAQPPTCRPHSAGDGLLSACTFKEGIKNTIYETIQLAVYLYFAVLLAFWTCVKLCNLSVWGRYVPLNSVRCVIRYMSAVFRH